MRYSKPQIALHWLILLLIAVTYAAIELKGFIPKPNPWHNYIKIIHFNAGILVLVLMLLRVYLKKKYTSPAISPKPPAWQTGLSHLAHSLLYLGFIALPILGISLLFVAGKSWPLLGISMPAASIADKATAGTIKDFHEWIANAGYFVIGIHAIAALYHHYVVKDDTLVRMMPNK
ncbi:cytochrome b561 [Vibrio sp. S11_S32]|uniref:cytochrome b561 n=1 Tax=Vibrio sp. S11_S32 TaxID=2720225 RepID=UPI001680AF80|nr:cytochrome b561 [Vibrio sp. S11_S32]MBD1576002.1 cytochrome b561 [Vibrio sp. S11_S32]